jgi:hypothetical protein
MITNYYNISIIIYLYIYLTLIANNIFNIQLVIRYFNLLNPIAGH